MKTNEKEWITVRGITRVTRMRSASICRRHSPASVFLVTRAMANIAPVGYFLRSSLPPFHHQFSLSPFISFHLLSSPFISFHLFSSPLRLFPFLPLFLSLSLSIRRLLILRQLQLWKFPCFTQIDFSLFCIFFFSLSQQFERKKKHQLTMN